MLLWIASFCLVGSWIIPLLAHAAGFRKESLTYGGRALCSLLTDITEGLTGITILHHCLARFHPLPSHWFRFSIEGKWQFDVALGCLMFPMVNWLSQVKLDLLPILPSSPITVSGIEQSIVARDPGAMTSYAIVVSIYAPVWEEIVFHGFLLPSLTRYIARMVLNSCEFSSFCLVMLQFAEDDDACIPRSGDGCCLCAIKEPIVIHSFS